MLTEKIREHLIKSGLLNSTAATELNIASLAGGANQVFLVTPDDQRYVIKIPKPAAHALIDRDTEYHASQITAAAGLSIDFCYFDKVSGVTISLYQPGSQVLTPALMQHDSIWQATARLLQTVHALPQRFQRDISIFAVLDFYKQRAITQLPPELADILSWNSWLEALRAEFAAMPIPSRPCHNDPMLSNFLFSAGRLYLIDWEYAGNNDPCWDLASVAADAEFSPAQEQRFLDYYFQDALDAQSVRRFQVYKVLSDYLGALWCVVMHDPNAENRWRRFQQKALNL